MIPNIYLRTLSDISGDEFTQQVLAKKVIVIIASDYQGPGCVNGKGLYSKHFISFINHEWAIKLECYITLGWKGLQGTNTSLLGLFVSYEDNEVNTAQVYIAQWQIQSQAMYTQNFLEYVFKKVL